MNKAFFYSFIVLLFFSCQKKLEKNEQDNLEAINTISVIIDDQLWNSEVGDSIRNKFASPVLGLPQEEPLFTIKQFPIRLFEGFSTGSRNRIVIKKSNENKFVIRRNEFSKSQNSFIISGKSTTDIIYYIQKHAPTISNKIREAEIIASQGFFSDSLQDTKKIKAKFNVDIKIPFNYDYVMRRKNFIWLKKEIISGNTSLLIYQIPFKSINATNAVNDIVRMRDSIGKKYIYAKDNSAKMKTEEAYFPYFSFVKLCDLETYETKGTWEMDNDFMNGPFINYAIKDEENNRMLILEGFCYAPSKEKRDLMFELESIIKSVKIYKNK
jgi:hypothetical protein